MTEGYRDQAAGLRALLNQSPPDILAVMPFGADAVRWVARQAAQRAEAGRRVLAFDEWQICGNFSDRVGVAPRFDLQHVLEGAVALDDCMVEAPVLRRHGHGGLAVVATARLASRLDGSRILQQRMGSCLNQLQTCTDEWLLLARPCEVAGMSSFARAASRLLMVVEAEERALTQAYATLKRLMRNGDGLTVGVSICSQGDERSGSVAARFRGVAAAQLGIKVAMAANLADGFAMGGTVEISGFVQRLLAQARTVQNLATDCRSAFA